METSFATMRFDQQKKADDSHRRMIFEICNWLYKNNVPFATSVTFKSGYKPDIICPTHIKPVIEVRATETEFQTIAKMDKIPAMLQNEIIYVSVYTPRVENIFVTNKEGKTFLKHKSATIINKFKGELIL